MPSDLFHPLNVETVWAELFLDGLSECSVWRMNLLACSRKDSSVFFIAVRDHVHCYRFTHPHDPNPELFDEFVVESAAGVSINAMKIGMIGNEEVLVAVNDAGGVFCWFTESFERHPLIFENGSSTWGTTTHNETRLLAVSANNHNITIFNLQYSIRQTEEKNGNNHESEETNSLNSPLNGCEKRILVGHANNVPDIDFSPCGWYLASVSIDSSCRVWNVYSGEVVWQKQFGSDWGWSVHFVSPTNFKSLPLSDIKKERADKYPELKKVENERMENPLINPMLIDLFRLAQDQTPHDNGTSESQDEEFSSAEGGADSVVDDRGSWATEDDDGDEDDFSGEDDERFDGQEDAEEEEEGQEEVGQDDAIAQVEEPTDENRAADIAEQPASASVQEETTENPETSNASTGEGWGFTGPVHLISAAVMNLNNNNDDEYLSDYDGHDDSFEGHSAYDVEMDDYYDDYDDHDGESEEDHGDWIPSDTWNVRRSWDLEIDSNDDDDDDVDRDTADFHRDRRQRESDAEMVSLESQPENPSSEFSEADESHAELCPGSSQPEIPELILNATATAVPTSSPIISKINVAKPRPINVPDNPTMPPIPMILCTTVHDLMLLEPDSWPPRLENSVVKESEGSRSDENNKIGKNDDEKKLRGNLATVALEKSLVSRYDKRLRRNIAPFERLNMVEWIPELSLAIVASQKGYAALVRLIRVYPDHAQPVKGENAGATSTTKGILEDPENGGYVMHIESYLPLDDAPPAPLLGFFVSVHDEPSNNLHSTLASSSLPYYRVCMIYYDKSMNLYEIRKDPKRLGRLAVELLAV